MIKTKPPTPNPGDNMKTYKVTLTYVAYAYYDIDADSKEDAIAQAWDEVRADSDHATSYGEWDLVDVEEEQTA